MCVYEQECSAATQQGGQTGQGDTAWVVSSSSTNRSTRHTARSNFTSFHCIKFMLVNFFPCCQFSKVCPKPALSPRKFGVVSAAGSNTAKLPVPSAGVVMEGDAQKPDLSQLCPTTLTHQSFQIFTWPQRHSTAGA